MPAGAATSTASTDQLPLSGIKESSLDRSATNANQGCFAACASMIKKVGRQNFERETTMITKKMTKLLALAVDQSILGQQTNQRINLKAGSDFVG